MKIVPILATATLVAGSVVAMAQPATAALTTICNGTAADVTVPGDLVVRGNQTCSLTNVTVNGNVRLGQGADLIFAGGAINGTLQLQADAYVDLTDTSVAGSLLSRSGYGVYAEDTDFARNVTSRMITDTMPFLFTVGGSIAGNVTAAGTETLVDGTLIAGNVTATDGDYTDFFDSSIDGSLTVSGMEFGSAFCESEVYGNATYTGNAGGIQLGTTGALAECEGMSVWGGNVTVSGTTGGVEVDGNIVRGTLSGEGNDPAPVVGENNRVRGGLGGQFAEAAGVAPAEAPMTLQAFAVDRKAQALLEAQQRSEAAVAEATALGKAF